jgi:hypothetical protein
MTLDSRARPAAALEAPDLSRSGPLSLSTGSRRALSRVLIAFLMTRLILYVVAAIAIRLVPPQIGSGVQAYLGKNLSLAACARWDAGWYLSIA